MTRLEEQLSEQFYHWEKRGRGWTVFPTPIYPEPPFVPFTGHTLPATSPVDDTRKPTFFSSLVNRLSHTLQQPPPRTVGESEPDEEAMPTELVREPLAEFQALLPDKLDVSPASFEQFLLNLALCREPIAFELMGTQNSVKVQFAAAKADGPLVHRQLRAHFREAAFVPGVDSLMSAWNRSTGEEILAVEFGLEREFMFPLANGKIDPFIGIIGALSELQPGELGLFQVLWQPVEGPWVESIVDAVMGSDGKPYFVNAAECAHAAQAKISKPLYAAVVRIMVCADTFDRMMQLASDLSGSLRVFASVDGNSLIPLRNEEYPYEAHIDDVLRRQTRRSGIILNSDELTGFVHLPSSAVRLPVLQRNAGRTKAAPEIVRHAGVLIGDNEHYNESIPVYLTADQRVRHTHIIGASGMGKSSLLYNLITQDIRNGDGVAVLDPHGDLINQILGVIPENRIEDVVIVNPADIDFPIGFNVLQAHSEEEKNLIASDLIAVFRRLASSWGDQMDVVLQNAILAFLESPQGGTLADLRRFLLEKPFRHQFLQTVNDPEIIYYWQSVFPTLTGGKSVGPILTRLQDFFSRKPLRNMVSQRDNKLDFRDIMDTGKIFLAPLSQGLCGVENSYLLGTLLVSKFQQLAMARQSQDASKRKHFWLYIDEFDHFITPSMAEILKGARKYRLGLTLAHQELHQLRSDPKVESAVLTQPCTRIVFRVGDDDAKRLGEGFESFDAKSITNLEKFHAIARVERNDFDFNLAVRKPNTEDFSGARQEAVITASRKKYATPRAKVEAALLASLRPEKAPNEAPKASSAPIPEAKPIVPEPPSTTAHAPQPITVSEKETVVAPPVSVETKLSIERVQVPKDLGRGGAQHQAIQKRIKEAAEKWGFRSVIEKQVSDGQGSVDLWLERDGHAIACEISISTTIDHEVRNVGKCLKAGVPKVAVICLDGDRLRKIEAAVSGSLGTDAAASVAYFQPDPFIAYLKKLPAVVKKQREIVSHGFKIKSSTSAVSIAEQKAKEDAAIRAIAETFKRKKKP